MTRSWIVGLLLLLGSATASEAKVSAVSANGFVVGFEADVTVSPQQAYEQFLSIANWWSSSHTYSGDAKNMTIDARPDGCWCEIIPGGGHVRHMDVGVIIPGKSIVLRGGLGPLAYMGVDGSLSVSFERKGTGTHVKLRYAVGGFDEGRFKTTSKSVDGVLAEQFVRYKNLAGSAAP